MSFKKLVDIRKAYDWEPAEYLLKRIRAERRNKEYKKKELL
jgi:hypothetical protein